MRERLANRGPREVEDFVGWLRVAGSAPPPQRLDHLPNGLGTTARNYQERVFRIDDDQVLDSNRGDQSSITKDQAAGRVDENCFTIDGVPLGVGGEAVLVDTT